MPVLDVRPSDVAVCSARITDSTPFGSTAISGLGFGDGGFGDGGFGGDLIAGFIADAAPLDARISDLARVDVSAGDRQIGRVLVSDRN